jgi:hypothetical protein
MNLFQIIMRIFTRAIAPAFLVLLATGPANGEMTVEPGEGTITVSIDGEIFTEYIYTAYDYPTLYPVIGPTGAGMTRNYPMVEGVEGEATDHLHHKSLWYAHSDVNGVDFWAHDDKIVLTEVLVSRAVGDQAFIVVNNSWGENTVQCTETRGMRFYYTEDARYIEFNVVIRASEDDVLLADAKEAGMAIRLNPYLRLNGEVATGMAVNSEGITSENNTNDIWGKRAEWIDYYGQVDDSTVGVAVFDHPGNPRHPTTWHARDYGLIAANPFGLSFFEGGNGDTTVSRGDSITFKYLFVFHKEDAAGAGIDEIYNEWILDSLFPDTTAAAVHRPFPIIPPESAYMLVRPSRDRPQELRGTFYDLFGKRLSLPSEGDDARLRRQGRFPAYPVIRQKEAPGICGRDAACQCF